MEVNDPIEEAVIIEDQPTTPVSSDESDADLLSRLKQAAEKKTPTANAASGWKFKDEEEESAESAQNVQRSSDPEETAEANSDARSNRKTTEKEDWASARTAAGMVDLTKKCSSFRLSTISIRKSLPLMRSNGLNRSWTWKIKNTV